MSARGIRSAKKFGAKSTAMEVIEGHDLTGYEIIVTGASSGIGIETARAFAKAGARVVLAVRDIKKTESVADDIKKSTGNSKIEIEKLELDNLASVNDFVKRYLATNRPLHILVNNAGIMGCPLGYTKDGFEMQFGTNHMGHFALTIGLIPALKKAHEQTKRTSRVVNVSSMAHGWSNVVFDDINFKTRPYEKNLSYGQSKTANILFSVAFSKHYGKDGILANALMPGAIMTNLARHIPIEELKAFGMVDENGKDITHLNDKFKNVEQGASTSVWAAVAKELENVGGKYLENCQFAQRVGSKEDMMAKFSGYLDYIYDEANAEKLWKMSHEWLKNPPK